MQKKKYLLGVLYSLFFFPAFLNAAEPVQLIAETARSITFTVDIAEPVFEPVGDAEGVACFIEGFSLYHERQKPGVVLRGVMAAIPPGARVEMQISVNATQDFKNIDLAPVPTYVFDAIENDAGAHVHYSKDQQVYSSNEYFPAQPAAIDYTGSLRGMHFAQILLTPVQYNPVQRIVRVARSMTVTLSYDGLDEAVDASQMVFESSAGPAGSTFDAIRDAALINPDSGFIDMRFGPAQFMAEPVLAGELQSSPFAIKIITSEPGMYRLQYEDISMLGVDLSGLTNSNIKVENHGQEVAVYRSGTDQFESGDYILFYVEDFQSEYSSTNVYWLYQGSSSGLVMQTLDAAPVDGFLQPESFTETVHFEQDLVWRRNLPDYAVGEDQWFWQKLDIFNVNEFDIDFSLEDFDSDAGFFSIEVSLRGITTFDHYTKFFLNGVEVGDSEWNGTVIENITLSGIDPALFNNGANTLKVSVLTAPNNESSTPDQYYLNRVSLAYARHYLASSNRLAFAADSSGGKTFEVSNFTDPAVMVFDVTHPKAPVMFTETVISTDNATSSVRFECSVDNATLLYAATPDSALVSDALVVDTPSDLMSERSDIDYIIITHAQFASTVEDLRTIREQAGLNVEIVDVQDIYDEFSFGIKDVTAIKDFLEYAYFNWHVSDHPTYVVLVGDATYDYRDNRGLAASGKVDLVPTYLGYRGALGTSVGATASDNWYVCVDGDDPLPDMIIGRLCVKNNQDLQNIIDKIQTYENGLPDEWQSRVIFAADEDDENIFEELSESLIEILPADYTDLQMYLSQYGSDITTATADLIETISNGALITNYFGHGSVDSWSASKWFQTPNQNTGQEDDNVADLTNTDQYTFLIILNCLSGAFSEAKDDYCMAEEFVRQQNKGAVMCVAPSASGYLSQQSVLGKKIYDYLFNGNITIGGALLTTSKIAAYQQTNSRDMLEVFIFFGDPALELKVLPECTVDGDCPDGVCSESICVECADDDGCPDGVCLDNLCVECAVDGDCPDGTCEYTICVDYECVIDDDCDVGVCVDNLCVECAIDGDCLDGVCLDNRCVECAIDGDCPDGVCADNLCVECVIDGDCPDGVCADNLCVECVIDSDCPDGVCADNLCVECAIDGDCPDGVCADNLCVECAVDGDCPDGVCEDTICVDYECVEDDDCDDGVCLDNKCVECANDSDCPDGVCLDNMCVECANDADCLDGVCFDTTCVECADDSDCERGMCTSNVCVVEGEIQVDTCKVKAGNNAKGDRIKFKGSLDATETDFNTAGGHIVVTIEADGIPDLNATTFDFPLEEDYVKKGKYKSPKIKSVDKSDPVTSLQIDTSKEKFKFSAKNVDLTGLSCPIIVTIKIGTYVAEKVLYEDIVNGPKKPCPPELLAGG